MRLQSIDFLRGLALTVVLLDHIDFWARPAGIFRDWTLMGLGFSDAADAFAFLSGFTFGWVYGPRIASEGFLACQRRAFVRTFQIYCAYVATAGSVVLLGFALRDTQVSISPAVAIADVTALRKALVHALVLMYQPFGLGILCLYVVVLPCLPILLVMCRRCWWSAIVFSAAVYAIDQYRSQMNLPTWSGSGWGFSPMGWQFVIVLGMACGARYGNGMNRVRLTSPWACVAAVVVIYAVLVKKAPLLFDRPDALADWVNLDAAQSRLLSKVHLGPLRLVHFLSVAYLTILVLPHNDLVWRHAVARPFVLCGRHSLPVYCAGTILAYSSVVAFRYAGSTPVAVAIIALDACLMQFGFAAILERRRTVQRSRTTSFRPEIQSKGDVASTIAQCRATSWTKRS